MTTLIQIATKCRLSALDLQNCGFSKSDGEELLQAFKSGLILNGAPSDSDGAIWLLNNNQELKSQGPKLSNSAESFGIRLYGIPRQDGRTSYISLCNDDEFLDPNEKVINH